MSDVSHLRAYINEVDDLPTDILLGRIVLFTISDQPIRRDELVKWFKELSLNAAYLPAENKPLDAFKRATSAVRESYQLLGNRTAQLLCRDVSANNDYVIRQITREVKNTGKKVLHYDEAIRLTFHRPKIDAKTGARIQIQVQLANLEQTEVTVVQEVARSIEQRYSSFCEFLDDQKVRGMVREYLKHLNSIEIKGGVYFVPVSRDDELHRLAELVGRLGGGCHMNTIPLVDLQNQREFIAHVFEREASESLREITREANEVLANRKTVTPAMYRKIKERYDKVLENAVEHVETLQLTQDVTAASAEVALQAIKSLAEAMLE